MANSIYLPIQMSPYNTSIDSEKSNQFSATIRCSGGSTCKSYQMKIYLVSTNVKIYDTGIIILSTPLYDSQTLPITVPENSGMINGNVYKWVLSVSSDGTNFVQSYECGFFTHQTATIDIGLFTSPFTQNSHIFTAIYTQPDGDPLQYCIFYLYSSDNKTVLRQSDQISNVLQWNCTGLINNTTYGISVIGVTNSGNTISSPIYNFIVSYTPPNIYATPKTEVDCTRDSVKVYTNFSQINGTAIGSYLFGTYYNNTPCVVLGNLSSLYWNEGLNIPRSFTAELSKDFEDGFEGNIIKFEDTTSGMEYLVYYKIDSVTLYNTTNNFKLGTSDEYIYPLEFKNGSVLKLAFNGSSSGNIVNPIFTTNGNNSSTLTINGTIHSTDRFTYDGVNAYINGIVVPSSGQLIAYINDTFSISGSIIPNLELTYQKSTGHLFYQIGNSTYSTEMILQANTPYLFGFLPTSVFVQALS